MSGDDLGLARLADLAVDDLLDVLDAGELLEYKSLRLQHPGFDPYDIEQAIAIMHLAAGVAPVTLPARLELEVAAAAEEYFGFASSVPSNPVVPRFASRSSWLRYVGWGAVAAGLLLTVWLQFPRPTPATRASPPQAQATQIVEVLKDVPGAEVSGAAHVPDTADLSDAANVPDAAAVPDPAADRARFMRLHPSVWQRSFLPGTDPTGQLVSGDVVWDPKTQAGYMRFHGLRPNNPNVDQYQLWIFDARRDPRFPVDGGVFNVASGRDAVVAFKSKLPVEVPLMFVVTVERRGGVVVSDRERVAAVASSG